MISRRGVLAGLAALGAAPALAGTITLDQLVGESLILGFLGSDADAEGADRIERELAEGRIGGVLFLRHNARTRDGVLGLAQRFRAAAPNAWLAIDQEGGFVQRLTDEMGFTDIPTAEQLLAMGLDGARPIFAQAARELAESGFSMNLAPVADLQHEATRSLIAGRAPSAMIPRRSPPIAAPSSTPWKRKAWPAPSSTSPVMGVAKATVMTLCRHHPDLGRDRAAPFAR